MPSFRASPPPSVLGSMTWNALRGNRSKMLYMDPAMKTGVQDQLERAKTVDRRYTSIELSFTCKTDDVNKTKIYKITKDNENPNSITVRRTGLRAFFARFFCMGGKLSSQMAEQLNSYIYPSGGEASQTQTIHTNGVRRVAEPTPKPTPTLVDTSVDSASSIVNSTDRREILHEGLNEPTVKASLPKEVKMEREQLNFLWLGTSDFDGNPLCDRYLYLGLLLGMPVGEIMQIAKGCKSQFDNKGCKSQFDNNSDIMRIITDFAVDNELSCRDFFRLLKMTRERSCTQIDEALEKADIDNSIELPPKSIGKFKELSTRTKCVNFRQLVSVEVKDKSGISECINVLEIMKPWISSIAADLKISNNKLSKLRVESHKDDFLFMALILNEIQISNADLTWEKFRDTLLEHRILKNNKKLCRALDELCSESH